MNSQITGRWRVPLVDAAIRTFFPNTKFPAWRAQISDIPMARLKLADHIIHPGMPRIHLLWLGTYYRLSD